MEPENREIADIHNPEINQILHKIQNFLWIWRSVDMEICGYGDLWIWRSTDMEICGYEDLWI